MKIIFFGTTIFAARNLEYLYQNGVEILSVVTNIPKKEGRGRKLTENPVKKKAEELKINTLSAKNLEDDILTKQLIAFNADLFIVVAFRMLPKNIWTIPSMGTINLHASLLPKYRGAAPINRVLINGEKNTGITTFFINERMDSGHILLQEEIQISKDITAAKLHDILMKKGSKLLYQTIKQVLNKRNISASPQKDQLATKAPKLNKKMTRIDWKGSVQNIHNLIRGLSPVLDEKNILKDVSIFPGAWCKFITPENQEIRAKILLTELEVNNKEKLSIIETDNKSFLKINLNDGSILIKKIQLAGKRPMDISEFLLGNKINEDWKIN